MRASTPWYVSPRLIIYLSYLHLQERIDVNDPPLPPTEFNDETPTPYQEQRFDPGPASDEAIRQLIINRLEICGKGGYEVSYEANEKHLQRVKVAQQLELEGKVPTSLSQSWNRQSFASASETGTDLTNLQDCDLTPVNLEQHPVFRKIVKKCTDMFQTAHSIISVSLGLFIGFVYSSFRLRSLHQS